MRPAYVIAEGKQVRFSLCLSLETWERESALTSSRGIACPAPQVRSSGHCLAPCVTYWISRGAVAPELRWDGAAASRANPYRVDAAQGNNPARGHPVGALQSLLGRFLCHGRAGTRDRGAAHVARLGVV